MHPLHPLLLLLLLRLFAWNRAGITAELLDFRVHLEFFFVGSSTLGDILGGALDGTPESAGGFAAEAPPAAAAGLQYLPPASQILEVCRHKQERLQHADHNQQSGSPRTVCNIWTL